MIRVLLELVCVFGGIAGTCLSLGYLVITGTIAQAFGGSWPEEKTGIAVLGLSLVSLGVGVALKKTGKRTEDPAPGISKELKANEEELKRRANEGRL